MAREVNSRLMAARAQAVSVSSPGEPLGRQELAELVAAYVWHHHRQRVAIDDNYVGKLERGVIRWPGHRYREALRAVLGAATDRDLGFTSTGRALVPTAAVPAMAGRRGLTRAEFLRSTVGAAGGLAFEQVLGPVLEVLRGGEPTATPTRIGITDIEQIRTAAAVFAGWDHTYGGGLAREAVQAQLRWSVGLLGSSCPQRLAGPLRVALGWLAHTAGFAAFDGYAHTDARVMFRFALACAEDAGDWHLRAKVLSSMARQAIWTGHPDDGLTLTELALVRADRLTATEQAMLHTAHARALAKMGRVPETLAAIGRADDAFARAQPARSPWMAYCDAAQHSGDTGHALFDLAVSAAPAGSSLARDAAGRLEDAVAGHTSAYARSRAIARTKLASLVMATADPVQAVSIGRAALAEAGPIRSRRAADDLRELTRYAAHHAGLEPVEQLRAQIAATLTSSTGTSTSTEAGAAPDTARTALTAGPDA